MVARSGWLAWMRASEWWNFKLLPPLAIAYATALYLGAAPADAWLGLLVLLASLVPGAVFVSVLNDWTDRADDALAGKPNRLADAASLGPAMMMGAALVAGALFLWLFASNTLWPGAPGLAATYAAGWIAYAAYSIPPVRLKARGFGGIVCDSVGANVVPALLAAQLAAAALGQDVPPEALAIVGLWSFCFGLRGILWHQIGDAEADAASDTKTFIQRFGVERTKDVARAGIFPLECLLLALIVGSLPLAGIGGALAGLALYLWLVWHKTDRFDMTITIVQPRPRSVILLHEYYDIFLPLALLVSGSFLSAWTLLLLAAHLAMFPARNWLPVTEAWRLRDPQFESRRANRRRGTQ